MKRTILIALVAVAAGVSGLLAQTPAAGPKPKSQGELKAVQALIAAAQAQGTDTVITAAEELLSKYADTEFKEIALSLEAGVYEKKGDYAKQQVYLERILEANPKNADAQIKLGDIIVKHVRENDLDKEDKLARAEKLLNSGMENAKVMPKPGPQISDADWEQNKKYMVGQAEDSLGLAAMDRKKWDVAIKYLTAAIADLPEAAFKAQLASAYQQAGQNDDALALCEKLLADPQTHPQIKNYVQAVKAAATKAKGTPAPAPAPGAGK